MFASGSQLLITPTIYHQIQLINYRYDSGNIMFCGFGNA